jgi:hypothetical protein
VLSQQVCCSCSTMQVAYISPRWSCWRHGM